jgi:hypothetical protein
VQYFGDGSDYRWNIRAIGRYLLRIGINHLGLPSPSLICRSLFTWRIRITFLGSISVKATGGDVTLQDFALLAPIVMVLAVTVFVLAEELFNQRAMMREKAAAAAATSSAPVRATDTNERTIRRIAEMLREVEPTEASREH